MAFGSLFGYLAVLHLVQPSDQFRTPLMAVYILMLVGTGAIFWRDRRNFRVLQEQDCGEE
jgi:hypothetical protein